MENTNFSESELAAIREMRNAQNRAWWAKMSPEQRRKKRRQYTLNAVKRQQATAARDGENKRYETKSRKRGLNK